MYLIAIENLLNCEYVRHRLQNKIAKLSEKSFRYNIKCNYYEAYKILSVNIYGQH